MKTKSLILALAMGLVLLTGCKKKEEAPAFSWPTQFQKAVTYYQQDFAQIKQLLLNEGFVGDSLQENNYFGKVDISTGDIYFYNFVLDSSNRIKSVRYGVISAKSTELTFGNSGYAELVKYIGKEYNSSVGLKFLFNHVSYNTSAGATSTTVSNYDDYLKTVSEIANYSSNAVWDCLTESAPNAKISLERDPVLTHMMFFTFGDKF